jgi:PTS system mannose-specific IIB component
MYWVRVDNRLIHGQVIESWLPFTKSRTVVVVNDEIAADPLRQEIMGLAIPRGVLARFFAVSEAARRLGQEPPGEEDPNVLVLFATCCDAQAAWEEGLAFMRLNIGNLHYGPGKRQICSHVALSEVDQACLAFFSRKGVKLDFRCVPSEPVQVEKSW